MKESQSPKKRALILLIIILLISIISVLVLFFFNKGGKKMIADIYQDGSLLYSIDLSMVSKSYTLDIPGKQHGSNTISIQKDKIAIIWADCPDKLCVKQGAISTSLLPITCLPNHLVIQLRSKEDIAYDITSH